MGFDTTERANISLKIAAGVFDANELGQWYDSQVPHVPVIRNRDVLTEFEKIPEAATVTVARNNALSKPTIIQDYSTNATAIRLSPVSGTNNSTFAATSTYGNLGDSSRLRNWIHPTKVPRSTGLMSAGYTVRVFQGNPASGGVEILAASGLTGTGASATPAWIFSYDQGVLLVSKDYRTNLSNPYILGFRYIGKTLANTITDLSNGGGVVIQTSVSGVPSNTAGVMDSVNATDYASCSWDVVMTAADGRVRRLSIAGVPRIADGVVLWSTYGAVGDSVNCGVRLRYNPADTSVGLEVVNNESSPVSVSALRYPVKRL